jgi:hypothetical protein
MKKQCSNPKCRKGKIGADGGATISGFGNAFIGCNECGSKMEDVDEFYPEFDEKREDEHSPREA